MPINNNYSISTSFRSWLLLHSPNRVQEDSLGESSPPHCSTTTLPSLELPRNDDAAATCCGRAGIPICVLFSVLTLRSHQHTCDTHQHYKPDIHSAAVPMLKSEQASERLALCLCESGSWDGASYRSCCWNARASSVAAF